MFLSGSITSHKHVKRLDLREYHVYIRELNGFDEEYIEANEILSSVMLITEILVRTISFESTDEKETDVREILRDLTIGERSMLILQLRRMCFGENIRCLYHCTSCNEQNSFDISTSSILESVNSEPQQPNCIVNLQGYTLNIRPITGRDQEDLLIINSNGEKGDNIMSEQLTRKSIVDSNPKLPYAPLNKDFLNELSLILFRIDPLADITFSLNCFSCKTLMVTHFIPEEFFIKELKLHRSQLEQEIHLLALYYHWDERAILSLPITKRKKYLQLVTKTLASVSGYERE